MENTAKRSPRVDGKRNRVKLIEAAAPLARAGGQDLSLDQVAREAGVSIATLYRHFPTREALLLEISQGDAIHFHDMAANLLENKEAPEALRSWLTEMGKYGLSRPGMGRAFRTASDTPVGDHVYKTFADSLAALMKAGQDEGSIRRDLSADDVMLTLCGIWELKDSPDTRAQCDRLTGLIFDGLRELSTVFVR